MRRGQRSRGWSMEAIVSSYPKGVNMCAKPCLPEVNRAVLDACTDAPDHLVDAEIVKIIGRDDFESDYVFVLCQIGLALRNPIHGYTNMLRTQQLGWDVP